MATYDINKLDHGESESDHDAFVEVLHGSNEGIVALLFKEMIDESNLVFTAQTCNESSRSLGGS